MLFHGAKLYTASKLLLHVVSTPVAPLMCPVKVVLSSQLKLLLPLQELSSKLLLSLFPVHYRPTYGHFI